MPHNRDDDLVQVGVARAYATLRVSSSHSVLCHVTCTKKLTVGR